MDDDSKERMDRRSFLRAMGLGLAAVVCSESARVYSAVHEEKPVKDRYEPTEDDSPYGSAFLPAYATQSSSL